MPRDEIGKWIWALPLSERLALLTLSIIIIENNPGARTPLRA